MDLVSQSAKIGYNLTQNKEWLDYGKEDELKGSIRRNRRFQTRVVSAFAAENKLVLGQIATDEKSNEITAIPELLKMLVIEGCVVTIDAMGTQKEIAEQIISQDADYVLSLKENQKTLYEDIDLYMETEILTKAKTEQEKTIQPKI
jgi:predicted transposase YbfD/YdcC